MTCAGTPPTPNALSGGSCATDTFGVKFRRQHTVGQYTLDFYCPELKLAIEIDGGQHYEEAGGRHDEARDLALRAMGVRTLRYSNLDVLKEAEGVAEAIWDEIHRITTSDAAPSPSLSPNGLGERGIPSSPRHPTGSFPALQGRR